MHLNEVNKQSYCPFSSCGPFLQNSGPIGLDSGPQGSAPEEKTQVVFWMQVQSHLVPMETQPKVWKRHRTGQMGGGAVCSCAAVEAAKVQTLLKTGAAAAEKD